MQQSSAKCAESPLAILTDHSVGVCLTKCCAWCLTSRLGTGALAAHSFCRTMSQLKLVSLSKLPAYEVAVQLQVYWDRLGPTTVQKGDFVPLSAPVQRVFYLSTDAGEAQHEASLKQEVCIDAWGQHCSCNWCSRGQGLCAQNAWRSLRSSAKCRVWLLRGAPDHAGI